MADVKKSVVAHFQQKTIEKIIGATHYINLQELGVYLDPDFVWQHIVQYLSDLKTQAEQSPELSNDLKIDSKGFDKKRSFRPKMKRQ